VTADHWVRKHVINGRCTCDVLWVDEISQIDVGLLLQLSKLTFSGLQFLLSGDFNQFPPIGNCWRGVPVDEQAFERSNLLHTMAGGNRVTLTECRRSDAELFGFYSGLIEEEPVNASGVCIEKPPLSAWIAAAKEQFSFQGFCRWNLCISHRKRVRLNEQLNKQMCPASGFVKLEVHGRSYRGNCQQTMLLWPGIQLLGCVSSSSKGIKNMCLYTVEAVDGETVKIQDGPQLSHEQAKAWLRLSYAQTYASCQGSEFDGQLRLHDTKHRFFTKRHLFVGLSRARSARDVSVVD
jgi:hypothetical protein